MFQTTKQLEKSIKTLSKRETTRHAPWLRSVIWGYVLTIFASSSGSGVGIYTVFIGEKNYRGSRIESWICISKWMQLVRDQG